MLTAVLLALAGLLVHDYVQWRIARWQAAETARLVRLAVFGPDGPAPEDQRAVRDALASPDIQSIVLPDLDRDAAERVAARAELERLGPAQAINEAFHRDPAEHRSTEWATPPQGSARARRKPPEDE